MKTTPDVIAARIRAGYRPPEENPLRCDDCGAIRTRHPAEHHYCRRHGFYVHADGFCPSFSTEPYKAPAERRDPFKQEEFKL